MRPSTVAAALWFTFSGSVAAAEGVAPAEKHPVPASTAAEALGYQAETGVASTYVFRGWPQYARRTDASSQSTAALTVKSVGRGDMTLTAWNASALANARSQPGTATEIDLTASYAWTLADTVTTNTGYIAYLYPNHTSAQHVDGAHEVFGVLTLPMKYVTPSVGVYGELVRLRGAYATAGLSRSLAFRDFVLTPSASVGAAAYDLTPAHVHDVSAMLTSQWNFLGPAYVNVRLAYSYMGGRAADLPGQNGSFSGRSVPWTMMAVGLSR